MHTTEELSGKTVPAKGGIPTIPMERLGITDESGDLETVSIEAVNAASQRLDALLEAKKTDPTDKEVEIYTTADEYFDLELPNVTIQRIALEIKTPDNETIYELTINGANPNQIAKIIEQYVMNGHHALTRDKWLKIVSGTEIAEGKFTKFPAKIDPEKLTAEFLQNDALFGDSEEFFKAATQSSKRKAKRTKTLEGTWDAIGEQKPINPDSNPGRVMLMIAEGKHTIQEINNNPDCKRNKTWETWIKYDGRRLGYTIKVDANGIYSLWGKDGIQITPETLPRKVKLEKKAQTESKKAA